MPPIISIVGRSRVGKTTLIEKLIRELGSRGYQVATIKHAQEATFDAPGKDSWRHIEAGSAAVALSTPDRLVLIKPHSKEPTIDEISHFFGEEYDLILTEGFKRASAPKIEVHRREVGPPLSGLTRLLAIATDERLDARARQFSLDDVGGLADLLETGFIRPQAERISLYVNGNPVALTAFPRKIITGIILAVVSSLKGTGEIRGLDVRLRRNPDKH